jgi:hypothetical protein
MSFITSRTFTDLYNLDAVKKLYANFDKINLKFDENDKHKNKNAQKKLLAQLLVSKPTQYHYANGRKAGRLYGSRLQFLKRELRNTICRDLCVDVDMENAQVRVLQWWSNENSLNTPIVKEYCDNRKNYYHLKQDIIKVMNGGSIPKLENVDDLNFLTEFKVDINKIHKCMMEKAENIKTIKTLKKEKSENVEGRLCNKILEKYESEILNESLKFCDELKIDIENAVCYFDGFTLPQQNFEPQLLGDLNEHIFKLFGIPVNFVKKEMNDYFVIPDDWKATESENEKSTVLTIFDEFMLTNGDFVKNINNTPWVFDKTTGMWSKNNIGIFMNLCANTFGRNNIYGGNPRNMKELFIMVQTLPDATEFFIEGVKLRKGKILYKNGIKDIETDTFETQFNTNYFFTKRITRNYNSVRDPVLIEKTKKVLFEAPHDSEIAKELIKALGVAMTGKNKEELQFENLGSGSNGKSMMMEILLDAFPGYVEPFNITTIRVSPYAKANEHNDGLVAVADVRIGFSSESAAGMLVDSEVFKRLCTQEPFNARECGEKSVKIKPEMTLFSFGQNPLVFDKIDTAVQRRRRGFPWNKTFKKVLDGSLDFLRTEEAFQALDHILQDGYNEWKKEGFIEIEELQVFKEELDDEQDIFTELFEIKYEIADKKIEDNWILGTDLYRDLKQLKMSDFAIKKKLLAIGVEWVKTRKTTDINPKSYFKGIKKKVVVNSSEF